VADIASLCVHGLRGQVAQVTQRIAFQQVERFRRSRPPEDLGAARTRYGEAAE